MIPKVIYMCHKRLDDIIIHSKNWVDYQCDKGDKFWINFNNGGNNNYKKYKLI